MNKVKDSLKENLDEILKNLPSEFHEDAKKELDNMPDVAEAAPSSAAQISAIKAELVANPDVDESAAAAELTDIKAPEVSVPATKEETEAEMAALLAEVKKSID
ncbi:hypothetical protein [Lacinutrix jangbogonensis]|uniref:hypothetical protein n=1 Tax=Lacinutrix jangbogonensis TaxID=1469557 RepID=UPI00053CFFC5|nr:hypothetical protein [Lacinutrix jangbogonensis]